MMPIPDPDNARATIRTLLSDKARLIQQLHDARTEIQRYETLFANTKTALVEIDTQLREHLEFQKTLHKLLDSLLQLSETENK